MDTSDLLLEKLRNFSKTVEVISLLDDSEYILKYHDYRKLVLPEDEYHNKMKIFFEKIRLVALTSHENVFRVCSFGCGDGLVDNDILSTFAKENPQLRIEYVGIDLSPTYCQLAKDNLKPGENVEVKILNQNFLDFTDDPYDFIIAMHSLYYLPPQEGIQKALSLVKTTGLIVAAIHSYNALVKPNEALCHTGKKTDLCFSDGLAKALDTLGVQYERNFYSYIMNLTQCLKNNFQSPQEKNVLDFIAHVKLEFYPEEVTKTLIAYLDSICYGQPEKALLDITVECFCISKS